MFNSATLAVILLYILSAILFTSTTVSIAIYYAKRKADTEEKIPVSYTHLTLPTILRA